jgi:hypothetical protein
MRVRLPALLAAAVAWLAGCRGDCASAGDCSRGELCGDDGTCDRLPEAAPLGSIAPGAHMEVVAVYPAPAALEVPARATIVVLTTRTVDPATLDGATFQIEDSRRQGVTGAFDWLVDPAGFLFAPDAPLAEGGSYSVRVSTGVRDGMGEGLRQAASWSFTVAVAR